VATVNDGVVGNSFPKEWANMQQSTQNHDPLTFVGTIPWLALAPLPAVAVLVGLTLPNAGLSALFLVPYIFLPCYFAVVVFVVPIMAVWAPLRRPQYLVAGIWGTLCAWSAVASLFGVREFVRWEVMLGYGVAGCACGVFYAYLARRGATAKKDGLTPTA
jgi:hypothetical protein